MTKKDYDGYNYEKFQELAKQSGVSIYEKIGFPDSYRGGNVEELIFRDILIKCPILEERRNLNVLDIGPGCSNLQKYISEKCQEQEHKLYLADCPEMLSLIESKPYMTKIEGFYPETQNEIKKASQGIDVIICYSTFAYIFIDNNVWNFLDNIMELMNEGGQALIGDIPNVSKRKLFFASRNGIKFHQEFMNTNQVPDVKFNCIEPNRIDDSLLLSMCLKCQSSGFDAYVVPQPKSLPFNNRRDDIIIRRP